MFVKCVFRRNARNKGNKRFCCRGCYSDRLLCAVNVGLLVGDVKRTSEVEVSNSVSETSQDARVVMPKKNALKIVGN